MAKLPYEIVIQTNVYNALVVYLDHPNPTALPPVCKVGLGLTNKLVNYKKFLDSSIGDSNSLLFRFLLSVHVEGTKKGVVVFKISKTYRREFAETVSEWLQDNQETLDMLTPYFFPNSSLKGSNELTEASTTAPLPTLDLKSLEITEEEKQSIWEQIKDDFETRRNEDVLDAEDNR